MRPVTVVSFTVAGVSDICWPTIGRSPVSMDSTNASTFRRCVSVWKVKTCAWRKMKTVEMAPSWRKPKPRTWGPTGPVPVMPGAPFGKPNMPIFW